MAHGTLINGTNYGVSGGKCLVNGTSYSIQGGKTLVNGTGYDITFFDGYKIVVTHSDGNRLQDTTGVQLRINGTNPNGPDGEYIDIIDFNTLSVTTGTFYGTGYCQFSVFLTRGKLYINGVEVDMPWGEYIYDITTNVTLDVTYSTRTGAVIRITEQ